MQAARRPGITHHRTRTAATLAVVVAALAATWGSPAAHAGEAEKISLRAVDSLPTNHVFSVAFQNWMKRVSELTKNQVEFKHFPNEQLGKRKDMYDMARNGTADIAYVLPVDQPGPLARTTVMELPGITALSACGTPVLWKTVQTNLNEEYLPNGIRPILVLYVGGYEIFSNKELHTPADLKGMKIRSAGGAQDVTVKALGAVPIPLASPEVYEAVQRKTIDGVLFPWTGVKPYKMQEVTKNATFGAALGATALEYVVNERVYQRLPANVKEAMAKATEEVMPKMIAEQDKTLTDVVAEMKKAGMKVTELTAAERTTWARSLGDVERNWMESVAKSGVKNAKAVLDARKAATTGPSCS